MGTRRSKHNKGRKPFYKEINRETVRLYSTFPETARIDHRGLRCTYCKRPLERVNARSRVAATRDHVTPASQGGTEVVPCCIECNKTKGTMSPEQWANFMEINPNWWHRSKQQARPQETKVEPALVEQVKQYLAKRKAEAARVQDVRLFDAPKGEEFRLIKSDVFAPFAEAELVRSSDRDAVLQLYVERKISAGQLHAARKWQVWKEQGSIQPNMTIDWSQSLKRAPYQHRGDLTGSQWGALRRRQEFLTFAGPSCAALLDFCLEADRSRAELMSALKIDGDRLEAVFNELLTKLCECFGMAAHERYRNQIRRWRAAA